MKSKSKTFYRYILSYALVLFLPVAVLFTLFSSFLFDRYSHEIAESSSRLLGQMQENLEKADENARDSVETFCKAVLPEGYSVEVTTIE